MNPIENTIKIGRNEAVEFLTEVDELIDFAKICVSFANTSGGSIFIGVNEKGKLMGVNPEPELRLIPEVHEFIDGQLNIETVAHLVKHYCIIEVKVAKADIPLLIKTNEGTKVFYYRVESNTVEANKIIERYLNIRRFGKVVEQSKIHSDYLDKLGENESNLSLLYKVMDLKPNEVDKITAELIFLEQLKVQLVDKKFYFSRLKS
jgi:predicted HTH transcriptional regulator